MGCRSSRAIGGFGFATSRASTISRAFGKLWPGGYRKLRADGDVFPDVLLVDGGLGQLRRAMEAFEKLEIQPPLVLSLAKKEELVYVMDRSKPLRLSRRSYALRLLQYVRDEAHRFAQHYHHLLRRKRTLGE